MKTKINQNKTKPNRNLVEGVVVLGVAYPGGVHPARTTCRIEKGSGQWYPKEAKNKEAPLFANRGVHKMGKNKGAPYLQTGLNSEQGYPKVLKNKGTPLFAPGMIVDTQSSVQIRRGMRHAV